MRKTFVNTVSSTANSNSGRAIVHTYPSTVPK